VPKKGLFVSYVYLAQLMLLTFKLGMIYYRSFQLESFISEVAECVQALEKLLRSKDTSLSELFYIIKSVSYGKVDMSNNFPQGNRLPAHYNYQMIICYPIFLYLL
jgi:hypothetical protein